MLYKVVFTVVKLFFAKLKVVAKQKIKEPAVFVCNHLGPFGPLAMMLYFPALIRPWVSHRTTEKGFAAKEIAQNLFKKDSKAPEWLKKAMGKVLEGPALWVMKALNAIPVFFDAVRLCQTYNESMKALRSGVSIAVFADRSGEHVDESVKEGIQAGCLYLGRLYGRSAEKPLLFYPVHISRRRHEIIIGEPIIYHKSENTKKEIQRMGDYLSKAIKEMGVWPKKKTLSM
jgi:hypothetical protein